MIFLSYYFSYEFEFEFSTVLYGLMEQKNIFSILQTLQK